MELLQKVREGDDEALNRLIQRYTPILRRFARGRLPLWARDVSDTQDLVQDTLIHAMRHLGTFRHERDGALQAYLRQAIMNRIRDELRRAGRRPGQTELNPAVASKEASPLEEAIGLETLEQYEQALSELRQEEREAIIARVELGQSYGEVAAALDKPTADAARVAVSRALLRLAKKMKPVSE
jgi:RNA polymerase sigma-70 factor (ECF subfamily)